LLLMSPQKGSVEMTSALPFVRSLDAPFHRRCMSEVSGARRRPN
jgi:hypothetical protein